MGFNSAFKGLITVYLLLTHPVMVGGVHIIKYYKVIRFIHIA